MILKSSFLFLILVHELKCINTKTTGSTYFSSIFCIVSVIANVLASSLLISSVLCLSELSHSCNIIYQWLIKTHNNKLNYQSNSYTQFMWKYVDRSTAHKQNANLTYDMAYVRMILFFGLISLCWGVTPPFSIFQQKIVFF